MRSPIAATIGRGRAITRKINGSRLLVSGLVLRASGAVTGPQIVATGCQKAEEEGQAI